MTNEEKLSELRRIEGLDVDKGLKTIANMVPAYLRILGLFATNYERDKDLLDTQLGENDLEAFGVSVHGYKSALANLGVSGLSEAAHKLEKAVTANDMAYIERELSGFKKGLADFAERIKVVLG
jgi:HPt (histidine-containing phosphotransfer) domain-containing protein